MKAKKLLAIALLCLSGAYENQAHASIFDSASRFNLHFQLTAIDQWHGTFTSPYQGLHSLSPDAENDLSLTSTLFVGFRAWKYGEFYFDPELGGGQGFSGATGIAGFSNGEIYRVGNPTPTAYIGRIYWQQYFPLKGNHNTLADDGPNQLKDNIPDKAFRLVIGKYCLADFFDNNVYSHDPRTQFINWATMSNGAWDYPANTRGYTAAVLVGFVDKNFYIQGCAALEPTYANGPTLDWNISKTIGLTGEIGYAFHWKKQTGMKPGTSDDTRTPVYTTYPINVRVLFYNNITRAANYNQTVSNYESGLTDTMNVNSQTAYNGNQKYGAGLSFDMALDDHVGLFARAGWNNGQTASWAYTEIDETALLGVSFPNIFPKKYPNTLGICGVIDDISQAHANFLAAGGYGFIIGDGKLPYYAPEIIGEAYYNICITQNIALAVDYQYVQNPAYNPDRGPVKAIVSGRVHITF
jgi:high affinity Mn2+ porin